MLFPSFFNAAAGGYEIEQSLRFDGSSGFTRTHSNNNASSDFTLSMWFKKSYNGENNMMLLHTNTSPRYSYVSFGESSGDADLLTARGTASGYAFNTSRKYRDSSAWYHLVLSVDAGTLTKGYINGVLDQNTGATSGWYFNGTDPLGLGRTAAGGNYFNGYMAEVHFIDGQALDADSFGEYDNNGVWRPKRYTGSHGSNGFYLKFDPTATNGIGHDHSGNGNHWTPTGFSADDTMSDTPTKNWCTLNPIYRSSYADSNLVYSEGNLKVTSNANNKGAVANFAVSSGKWYYEATKTNDEMIGWHPADTALTNYPGGTVGVSLHSGGNVYHDGSNTAYGSSNTAAVIGCVVDFDNEKFYWSIDGTWQNSADPAANTGGFSFPTSCQGVPLVPAFRVRSASSSENIIFNAGQHALAYPPGTSSPTTAFNTVLYTGNSGTQSITGVGFQPDLVWLKSRSEGYSHYLYDTIRGAGNYLNSDNTNAEFSNTATLSAFDTNGFTLGNAPGSNNSGQPYVAWCFNAGTGSPVTNTDGTITSTVKASSDNGFSIVSYTGTGSAATVGHGLGVAPSFVVIKNRTDAGYHWYTYHPALTSQYYLRLNDTTAQLNGASDIYPSAPSSTVVNLGGSTGVNGLSKNYVAYCFADTPDRVKTGSYTGNSSTNYVDVGFKPAMVMLKNTTTASQWMMVDTERGSNEILNPNRSIAEFTASSSIRVNLTQSGFILNGNGTDTNLSGNNFIYIAFAKNFTADETFKSLNTANLPAPTVKDGSKNFNTVTYAGNSPTGQSITVGFQPDWLWIKARSYAGSHAIMDSIRGSSKQLQSNTSNAESTNSAGKGVLSFDTNGFTLGEESDALGSTNGSQTYVAWAWKAGGSGSSNTAGSITSTVSASPSSGFSIAAYSGAGSAGTVGHGLGVAPRFLIVKNRSSATAYNWYVWHHDLSSGSGSYYLNLNRNVARLFSNDPFNATAPTSTVFSVGGENRVNGVDYIAYCFAEVEGFSKFGQYTGSNTSDNAFVYCGFAPAWLMVKSYGTGGNNYDWRIYDSQRNTYNPVDDHLEANSGLQENGDGRINPIDFLSNGFKIRNSYAEVGSSTTYIFAAFAEHPFGGDGVSPATAR